MKILMNGFGVVLLVGMFGVEAFAAQGSACKETYDDLVEAVRALAQTKIVLSTKFATPAELAAEEESFLNCFHEMVRNKSDVNYSDSTGLTPALAAAHFRLYGVLEFLEKNGANIDLKDQSGYSARICSEMRVLK